MDKKLIQKIEDRKLKGTFRSLSCYTGIVDFYSNDYLGLSEIVSEIEVSKMGSTGSRLISGNSPEAEECESFLSDFFNAEAALVFNSGYDANLGIFSSVPQKGDIVLYDEQIHASVRDGIRLSFARSFSFKHNDYKDLEKKLHRLKSNGTFYVAIETLYSMSGDFAPLKEISELCEEYNAELIVDEAHSGGLYGMNGIGVVSDQNLDNIIFARVITFGKAYGLHGAVILCSNDLKEYLVNYARSFIYTTALPPSVYSQIKIHVGADLNERRTRLFNNILFFRNEFAGFKLSSSEKSPIQILRFQTPEILNRISLELQKSNVGVKAILPPTVSSGNECLRICIHSFNTENEIVELKRKIIDFLNILKS